MRYILEETYKISADSEKEAQQIIDEYKAGQRDGGYVLKKGSFERKEKKSKGELIAEKYVVCVVLTKGELWGDVAQ